MAKTPEAQSIIIRRKRILQYLSSMYPTPLQLGTLYNSIIYIDPDYDFPLFQKDIKYLSDKDYVEFIDEKIGGADEYRKKVVGLTPDGKEVAEGTDFDKALEI